MSTWITHFDVPALAGSTGPRLAVKDAIDVAGVPTTAGCAAVAATAVAALADAACLAGFRTAGAVIVGKANLDELCMGTRGHNPAFGSPVNPIAPDRMPGGSSSGSAVAVATGEVDLALGTDTGGSVRIPAACCGVVGLKTTWGRIPTAGVWPLAPSLDSVGPLAPDVAGIVTAMRLLAPDWREDMAPAIRIGRFRPGGVDPAVDAAIDAVLAGWSGDFGDVALPGFAGTSDATTDIMLGEFWQLHQRLFEVPGVGDFATRALRYGRGVTPDRLSRAAEVRRAWQAELADAFATWPVIALPTLVGLPPKLDAVRDFPAAHLTAPFNLAGVPALALPVARPGPIPTSIQLIAAPGADELLCATAAALGPPGGDRGTERPRGR